MQSDLTFIGFGPANVDVFCELSQKLKLLKELGHEIPALKIAIFDVEGNHAAGKPYGNNADVTMQFNNEMKFINDDFCNWIRNNKEDWLPILEHFKEGSMKTWFDVNKDALENNSFDDIYFPRFLYGIFKRMEFMQSLPQMPEEVEVRLYEGRAVAIDRAAEGNAEIFFDEKGAHEVVLTRRGDRGFTVETASDEREYSNVCKLSLLGIGSPEPRPFLETENRYYFNSSSNDNPLIDQPSFVEDLKSAIFEKAKENGGKAKLCILGAAASALDILNMVANDKELQELTEVYVVSSLGLARGRPTEAKMQAYQPVVIKEGYAYTTAEQFIKDVYAEVDHGINNCTGFTTQDILFSCGAAAMIRGNKEELSKYKEWDTLYDFISRTTAESQHSLDHMEINFVPGRIRKLSSEVNGTITVELSREHLDNGIPYNKKGRNVPEICAHDIVINCTGFRRTTEVPLIKDGISKGIFAIDESTRDLKVGKEDMSISSNVMLNGYLGMSYAELDHSQTFIKMAGTIASAQSVNVLKKLLGDELFKNFSIVEHMLNEQPFELGGNNNEQMMAK